MNRSKGTRGAITIFLVIILVPCMLFTSVFIDLSRVQLAKGVVASSADLALNELLTNYDADLAEWYGVIASCQDIDSFYAASAKLFERLLRSQGLERDEYYLILDYYDGVIGGEGKIYDLLDIEVVGDDGSKVEDALDDNSLANPTLMKDAIVEFMKYRAPIEITTTLIERIHNDPSVNDTLEAEINEPLCQSKKKFYEAEGELLSAAFNTYWAIRNYYEACTTKRDNQDHRMDNSELSRMVERVNTYRNTYKDIHTLAVKNLVNTAGLHVFERTTADLDRYNGEYNEDHPDNFADVYSEKVEEDGETHYYITGERINQLIEDLNTAARDFTTELNNCANDERVKSLTDMTVSDDGDNNAYPVQWWKQMADAIGYSSSTMVTGYLANIASKIEIMLRAYSKVNAISLCEYQGGEMPAATQQAINTALQRVSDLHHDYLTDGVTNDDDAYLRMVNMFEVISSNNQNKIYPSQNYVTVNGSSMSIPDALSYIKSDTTAILNELEKLVGLLNIAIDGNQDDDNVDEEKRVKSLDELETLAENYNTTLIAWNNQANSYDNDMHEADRTEIAGLNEDNPELDVQELLNKLNRQAVAELKTRLENIRSQLQGVIDAIKEIKYGEVSIKDIGSFDTFKSGMLTKVNSDEIKLKNGELNSYAESKFSELFMPESNPMIALSNMDNSAYNLMINPENQSDVDTPELFMYLHEKFKDYDPGAIDELNSEKDQAEAEGKQAAKNAKNKTRYHGNGTDIVPDFSGDLRYNLFDGQIDIVYDLIKSLIDFNINSIRDDLYVTAYVMNMFTCATHEEEGIYGLFDHDTRISWGNESITGDSFRPSDYDTKMGNASTDKTWLSDNMVDHYNKSLTNKLMNNDNNVAYAAEIEYILFGNVRSDDEDIEYNSQGDSQLPPYACCIDNVKSAYSNIYAIRYALNLVSAFQHFWSENSNNNTAKCINTVAELVALISHGIIPAPVTKIVILPVLTIFETAKDLDRLQAGWPVELYKKDPDYWWVKIPEFESPADSPRSISGIISTLKNDLGNNNKDSGLYYSDYLTFFVYEGLKGDVGGDMYKRMAEVMQTNMRNHVNRSGYTLKESKQFFTLTSKVKVKPMMIELPLFSGYDEDKPQNDGWCTFSFKATRGYS